MLQLTTSRCPKHPWTLALTIALAGLTGAVAAEAATPATSASNAVSPVLARSTEAQRDAWRHSLLRAPRPNHHACYRTVYPETQWHEIRCTKPPKHYFPPRQSVGGGSTNDYAADPPNPISLAEGYFDSVNATSLSSENAGVGGVGGVDGTNLFSLQLNTADFNTSVCPASASGCQGFVQFVYDNSSASAYVQYWLINPPSTCPGSWMPFEVWCVQTASSSTPFPHAATVSDLKDLRVIGSSAAGGEVIVYWGGAMQSSPGDGIIPDLASNWSEVEYNIFGDGGGSQAVFNSGTTIQVRTQVDTGFNVLPQCVRASFTGETNNLDLVSTPSVVPRSQYPAIVFDESNAGSPPASCSTSLGDTHITTFDGLYYDFQAAGDFVLADAGPDFIVQARQQSGLAAFDNPLVTVNTAVAVKMGANRIAIYDNPVRVVINGATRCVADGASLKLPGDVYLLRVGNGYAVTRSTGEAVRADLYNGWMKITVGLGRRSRSSAHGILASPTRTALSTATGEELKEPVSADDLYRRYAPSWVVKPNASLFAEHTVEYAAPQRIFFARDLDSAAYEKARAACAAAGVADAAHLDACTLDAAVLKDKAAIRPFVHAIAPRITIRPIAAANGLKQP